MSYPDIIKALPEADVPFPGITGHLMQGDNNQVVFFSLPVGLEIPPHSHGAQWGFVISGELKLSIGGVEKIYKAGDTYNIGDGEVHFGTALTEVEAVDFFADVDRYSVK